MTDQKQAESILREMEGRATSSGKLTTKDDEIDIKVFKSTWSRMYTFVGGVKVILPYALLVALYSQLNFYRESAFQEWANQASHLQPKQFLLQTLRVFGITFLTSALVGIMLGINMRIRIDSSRTFFNMMLNRVVHAPVNLYFDITPVGRILGIFNFNL